MSDEAELGERLMRVVVAGGGIAALEALAALHTLAADRVDATVIAPEPTFSYRPLSTGSPFTFLEKRTRSLAELAGGLGARFVQDGLVQVDESRSRVLTRDGDFVSYDALLVATGAQLVRGVRQGVTMARGTEWAEALAGVLRELESGAVRSVAFVVPDGAAWPMDAYELSLVAALAARRGGSAAKVFLITAEERPLERLGIAASQAVGEELSRGGVELRTGTAVEPGVRVEGGRDAFSSMVARLSRPRRGRTRDRIVLNLDPEPPLTVDRVMFLPAVNGPFIAGLGHDSRGFIPVDDHARIPDATRLYAAGDATASTLKHSTLSASQATAAAEALAAEAGAEGTPTPWSPVLFGILTLPPHFPGPRGSPWLDGGEPVAHCLWWPPGHVAGRHLAPYLAKRDPGVRPGLEWHPNGLPLAVSVASAGDVGPTPGAPSEEAMRRDALGRQLLAIRRAEREGEHLAANLTHRLHELEQHQREVVARLEAAGYLSHHGETRSHGIARGGINR